MKSYTGFWLPGLHLTLTHSKGQGQGYAGFDTEYLEDGETAAKILMPSNSKSCMGFLLAKLHFTVSHSKGQGQGHAYFDNEYL